MTRRHHLSPGYAALLALATFGCTTPKVEDVNDPTSRALAPKGVIRGTVFYQGPPPCTEGGHVVGSAALLVFDRRNPPPPAGLAKTAVNFVFSNGYLSKADAGQLADVISKLLSLDNADTAQQQPPPQQQVAQQGPPPPPPPPSQVELGMTEEQVRSILGQPTTQRQPRANAKVYVYSKQITFQNGKVSDIE